MGVAGKEVRSWRLNVAVICVHCLLRFSSIGYFCIATQIAIPSFSSLTNWGKRGSQLFLDDKPVSVPDVKGIQFFPFNLMILYI